MSTISSASVRNDNLRPNTPPPSANTSPKQSAPPSSDGFEMVDGHSTPSAPNSRPATPPAAGLARPLGQTAVAGSTSPAATPNGGASPTTNAATHLPTGTASLNAEEIAPVGETKPTETTDKVDPSELESLTDKVKTSLTAAGAAIMALVSYLLEWGKSFTNKVIGSARSFGNAVRGGLSSGLKLVRDATVPKQDPVEGRYEVSKNWVKTKVYNRCNWLLNKLA